MFDYETIRLIWWLFTGVIITGFALTSGFDFGVAALLPFLGRNDVERRVIINTIGGTWEGNQVWLVLLGGVLFAVWPLLYATLFSGLYVAMLLMLFALFFRPAGFDYRSKLEDPRWRNAWDWGLFVGGAVPPVLLGVLLSNLLLGLPFHLDADLRPHYEGGFLDLLQPFAGFLGLISLALTGFHGAIYLQWRTEGVLQRRARRIIAILGPAVIGALAVAVVWVILGIERLEITVLPDSTVPNSPLAKAVVSGGGWIEHFLAHPWMLAAPALGFVGLLLAWRAALAYRSGLAFACSAGGISGLLFTVGFGLFPFLLVSSTHPVSSLTLWDASASHFSLLLSFWITVVFLPIVLAYTRWVYRVLWGRVTPEKVLENQHTLY